MPVRDRERIQVRIPEDPLPNVGNVTTLAGHQVADDMDVSLLAAAWRREAGRIGAQRLVGRPPQECRPACRYQVWGGAPANNRVGYAIRFALSRIVQSPDLKGGTQGRAILLDRMRKLMS